MTDPQGSPQKNHIGSKARQLTEPFTGVQIAGIDDFGLSVFLCQGSVPLHRHIDEDEMFLVYSGAITVESEIGPVFLRAGELTVVPKGIRHRSSSPIRSEVIIFQPRMLADQRNGHRRLHALDAEGALSKINVYAAALDMRRPSESSQLVQVGDFYVSLTVLEGASIDRNERKSAVLLLAHQGQTEVHTPSGDVQLDVGNTLVVPREMPFSVSGQKRSLLLEFSRETV